MSAREDLYGAIGLFHGLLLDAQIKDAAWRKMVVSFLERVTHPLDPAATSPEFECGVLSPGENPYPCWLLKEHGGEHFNPKRGWWS